MESRSSGWELLGGLAIGAVGGLVVGLLMAPKAGGETRESVSDSILDMRERSGEAVEGLKGATASLLNTTRAVMEEKMSLLAEALDAGRKAAEYKRAELIDQED